MMKVEKVTINGKIEEIVTDFDDEYMNDNMLYGNNLDDTLEISFNDINKSLEDTMIISSGDDYDE